MPAILALAIFSGCRVDLVSARAKYPARIVALALCAVALLELSAPMPRVIATKSAPDQHLFEAIKSLPGEPVVELPAGGSSGGISAVFAESKRLLFSIGDWRKRFNGTSGRYPTDYLSTADVLDKFPSAESVQKLRDLKIRFVVLHIASVKDDYSSTNEQAIAIADALPPGAKISWRAAGAIITLTS